MCLSLRVNLQIHAACESYGRRLHGARKILKILPPRKFLSDDFISSYTRNRLFWLLIRENFENITNDLGGSQQEKEKHGLFYS
jgi:hypothetical protein